eukprot:2735654-Rhodomonas_salina.1
MSDLRWKDCSIKQLQGETIDTVPTQAHYVMWCDHTLRATKGIGAGYIKHMIEALVLKDELVPMLVPAANLRADGTADYNSIEFKLAVVTFAALNGKDVRAADPNASDLIMNVHFKTIDTQLASFRLQIADACKRHRSNVFAGTDSLIKKHPFRQLIEWKLLEHSFNQFKKSAEEHYFAELAELAVAPIELDFESLTTHMCDITAVCNNLLTMKDPDAVNRTFFGTLLKKLKACVGPAGDRRSMEWTILAVKWEQACTTDQKSLPWNTLKME